VVEQTNQRVGNLRANLIVSLRSSGAGDRRASEPRIPVKLAGTLNCEGVVHEGAVADISRTGLLFRASNADAAAREGVGATVNIERIGVVPARTIARSAAGIHLQFKDISDECTARLDAFIRSVEAADQRFIDAAKAAASKIAGAFEAAIVQGTISTEALFDSDYRAVPNTDPVQYLTAFIVFCDRTLPSIQEPVLALDPRVVFCAAVDRNGYLPTHNRPFSHPQRPNDPVWNTANSRNRRIFNDRAGLTAARMIREYMLQTYDREMGDGMVVTLKEVDAAIQVQGRHWGAVRLAFRA